MSTRVLRALWRTSLMTSMQYRSDFLLGVAMSLVWALWSVLPLVFVYGYADAVEGWSYPAAMIVLAAFITLRGLIEGLISPNLAALVEHVRTGTLDFVLLKPVDAQLMTSFSRVYPARLFDLVSAGGLTTWALVRLGHTPSPGELGAGVLCMMSSAAVLYSLSLCAAATTFWWVRVDAVRYLLVSLLDTGRWPGAVYRGWLRVMLTFIFPAILMTSYPARAVLGTLEPAAAGWTAGAAVGFLAGSRVFWRYAIRHYTSASS